jgi:cation diffusion facilitator CzcD-associated flavoprotein CzcO
MSAPTPVPTLPGTTRVVVIGAGPQGLATVLHLLHAAPSLRSEIVVLDPTGRWLTAWRERFARLGIDRLRSPSVHHPGPDPHHLAAWCDPGELGGPYGLPAT